MCNPLRRHILHWRRHKWLMVGWIYEAPAYADHTNDDRDFKDHDEAINESRFFCALDQQSRKEQEDKNRRQVDDAWRSRFRHFLQRRMAPLVGNAHPEPTQH